MSSRGYAWPLVDSLLPGHEREGASEGREEARAFFKGSPLRLLETSFRSEDTMTPLRDHLEKTSILIVDDSPLNRAAYSTVLGGKGYRITEASSGAEALERAGKEDFSVILLDVRMPGMDGFETARQLRQREETKYTPILFVSAFDQSQ